MPKTETTADLPIKVPKAEWRRTLFPHLQLLIADIKLLEESLNFCPMKMEDDYAPQNASFNPIFSSLL